jgi:hypothetical protein
MAALVGLGADSRDGVECAALSDGAITALDVVVKLERLALS